MSTYWDTFVDDLRAGKIVYAGEPITEKFAITHVRLLCELFYYWLKARNEWGEKVF